MTERWKYIKVGLLHIKSERVSNTFLTENLFGCLNTKYYSSHAIIFHKFEEKGNFHQNHHVSQFLKNIFKLPVSSTKIVIFVDDTGILKIATEATYSRQN